MTAFKLKLLPRSTLKGKFSGFGGTGDVVGPASANDNALAVYDGTTGKLLKNSNVILQITGPQLQLRPISDGAAALGGSTGWAGLALSGNTSINWAGGGVTVTYNTVSDQLAFAGAAKYTFDAAIHEEVVDLTGDGISTPVALNANLGSTFYIGANANRTVSVPTNKPAAGFTQKIIIRHEALGGVSRTLSLTTGSAGAFRFGTFVSSLSATTAGAVDYIGAIYNDLDDRWDIVSYSKGF